MIIINQGLPWAWVVGSCHFTHMGDLDALNEFDGPGGLHGVQLGQHFAGVCCEGDEDAQLGEGHQAN